MDKKNKSYTNGEITVFWKPSLCIHSTVCFTKLRDVFDPSKRPWVNMQGAGTDKIIDIVNQCPTDALTFKWNDKSTEKSTQLEEWSESADNISKAPTKVQVMKNGPLIIDGNFRLIGTHGSELKTASMVSLCRCGQSKNMPYCDGTHRKVGFEG